MKKSISSSLLLAAWICSGVVFYIFQTASLTNQSTLGIKTLKSLYEFNSISQFNDNIEVFRSYVSDDIFERMTADNTDRMLQVYLKFKAKPCYIHILESTPTYIVYSIVSESIEADRRFLFTFEIKGNKVVDIKEAELFMLPTSRGWEIDKNLVPQLELPFGGE